MFPGVYRLHPTLPTAKPFGTRRYTAIRPFYARYPQDTGWDRSLWIAMWAKFQCSGIVRIVWFMDISALAKVHRVMHR
ncbi:hypothetical protein BH09PSE3_BH09PSE3_21240 [soil metagenome]